MCKIWNRCYHMIGGELRGGAWVVIDPTINPQKMEVRPSVLSCRVLSCHLFLHSTLALNSLYLWLFILLYSSILRNFQIWCENWVIISLPYNSLFTDVCRQAVERRHSRATRNLWSEVQKSRTEDCHAQTRPNSHWTWRSLGTFMSCTCITVFHYPHCVLFVYSVFLLRF